MTAFAKPLSVRLHPTNLYNGDRMSQKEFHRAYAKTGEDFKAELIGGIVNVASPLQLRHGRNHLPLGSLLWLYESATPGVESGDNATVVLGDDSETQPDLFLRILPEFGGQSATTRDDYILGPPELIAEISYSSHSIDLNAKKEDFQRHGVLEYLVVSLKEKKLRWFDLGAAKEIFPDADGVCRIRCFPGLWIHEQGLFERDGTRLTQTLQQGLASPEHAQFAKRLAARARGKKG
jgi:Uma2 family endonuclease